MTTDLSLSYTLGATDCIICHSSNAGGVTSVVKPFGVAMKAAGLGPYNEGSLMTALAALEAQKTDSDCDGVPDIQQLKDGRDPNTGAYLNGDTATPPADPGCNGAAPTLDAPAYGCDPGAGAAQVATGPLSWSGAASLSTMLGLGALAARRGRRRPR